MKEVIKIGVLHVCKWLGLFLLSRFIYRRRLQILCYHGFSFEDEHRFRPSLFVTPTLFARRLAWLHKEQFAVLPLCEAITCLQNNTLPKKSTVITIDDGFYSFYRLALPLISKYDYPVTIYVTTYYVLHENPIYRLVIQYMFWKTELESVSVAELLPDLKGRYPIKNEAGQKFIWELIAYGENKLTEFQRAGFLSKLGELLNVDYGSLCESRQLSLLNKKEIRDLARYRVDVQLHTHRHCLPINPERLYREVAENRRVLEPLVGKSLQHLCYPSGIWNQQHCEPLKRIGVRTATTCQPGLNTAKTSSLGLNRFLDRNDLPQIEFEAEMYGFKELLRNMKRIILG